MGVRRVVDNEFWTHPKIDKFSPEDKYFMLYLLSNPFTKQLGIYRISITQAAFQMGYSEDAFRVLLDRFENKYNMILFSKETSEVAILNYLCHSILKGGKPVEDCIKAEMELVKDRELIDKVFRHVQGKRRINATVKKIIKEYFLNKENQNDIINDNDNENERIVPRIVPRIVEETEEASAPSAPSAPSDPPAPPEGKEDKPKKLKCGEYKNVLLSQEEIEKLTGEIGAYRLGQAIKLLDEYIEETGYKRKSHYLTIKRWVLKALAEREQKGQVRSASFDTDEFFEAAMAHSFDDDLVGVKTAANDEGIRERANEMRGKLGM